MMRSDEFVNKIFEEFLSAALIGGGFTTFVQNVFFEAGEIRLAGLDLFSDAAVPGGVAVFDKFRQAPVFANGRRDFEAAGECVHASDVRVEKVDGFEGFPAHFGVEIHPAFFQATIFQNGEHALGRQIDVGGELVRVPAELGVTRIRVD